MNHLKVIKQRTGDCPLERLVAHALDLAGIKYLTDFEGKSPAHLDFYLPDYDIYLEIKGGYSPRIARQLKRAPNVIVLQGIMATTFFIAKLNKR